MHEVVEQGLNYLRGIWRHRWYAMALAWTIVLVGWVIVFRMPDQYEASARVYVDTDSILRPLLRGLAVNTNVDQRLKIMTRTLLSRPNLEKVARMADLDINAKTPEDMEALLDGLAKNIKIQTTRRENLYTISYDNRQPQRAKRVVQSLLTIFVESTLGESRQDSDTAQKFLDQQINDYEQKLVAAENRLMDFKRANVGMLPGESGDFFDRLQKAKSQLEQTKLELRESQQRRDELKRQLSRQDQEDSLALYPQANSRLTTSVDSRIQALESKLDDMRLKYTNQHPAVIELKRTIALLEKQKREELKTLSASAPDAQAAVDPLFQQRTLALDQVDAGLAALRVRVQEYQLRVDNLRKMVNTLPKVETELKQLNRNYAINKKNYDELVSRRESARLSQDVKETGDSVKFRVVDPPRVPLTPSGPNRLLFSSIVLLLGIGAGLALAFLIAQLRPVVYDRRNLRQLSGFPVFGAVSRILTPEVLFKRRLDSGAFVAVGVLLSLVYAGVIWLHSGGQSPGVLLHSLRGLL